MTLNNSGYRRIITDREFEDYKSMKEYFRSRWHRVREIIFEGHQLATDAFVVIDGAEDVIALLGTAGTVFLSTLINDELQDGKSVWVVYQDNTGAIQSTILTLLDNDNDTSDEVPLGCEAVVTTVASVAGDDITLTGIDGTEVDEYKDMYVVGCGDATHRPGQVLQVLSSTIATPSVLTMTTTPNIDWADDNVSLQTYKAEDFYRVREMYCAVAPIDAKTIRLGDGGSTAIYGSIGETARYMASSGFFTQPATVCRSYLGKIIASMPVDTTQTENVGASIEITFTPKAINVNGGSAAISMEIPFQGQMIWEPCIELEPATDVIIKIKNIEGDKFDEIFVEITYLEVDNK